MKEIVINIAEDGPVTALHFDEFDLGFLGQKKVERASEILFNEDSQDWRIEIPDLTPRNPAFSGTPPDVYTISGFSGYDVARAFEVDFLQACMKRNVSPHSREAEQILADILSSPQEA